MNKLSMVSAGLLAISTASVSYGADWSRSEVHLQYGDLKNAFPQFGGEKEYSTTIVTLQHASGWKYGDNFYFVDHSTNETDQTFYGEWYPTFSSQKIFDIEYGGALKDIGFVAGFNAAPEVDILKYLPGVSLSWNVPGFAFFKTMVTAYIDASKGTDVPKEDDSYMIDIAWKYPFSVGNQDFDIQGHAEYITGRDFEDVDGERNSWILAQPQFRWNAGKTLFEEKDLFYLGIEYQYWKNKLGGDEKENVAQLLAVWVL